MTAWTADGELSIWPFLFCGAVVVCAVGFAVARGLVVERRNVERVRRVQDLCADGHLSWHEAERVA